MGGAVSAGEDNDELIDNLVVAEYIKTSMVEKAFRAVDRGDYFLEGCRENAYRDLAWKHGTIHMSAPCIYSEVMESLNLCPGMSFLNLGSGTGYLSTMAGLVLGTYGTNHGIELHQSNVDYAKERLEEFQNFSPSMDRYEFCAPTFVVGNCLLLDYTSVSEYDRVYCGASCPAEHENFIKNLVRVGGILVMPINDNLLQIVRTTETTFEVKHVLPVSFASLVVPNVEDDPLLPITLPGKCPPTLEEACRSTIRIILRKCVELENPTLLEKRVKKPKRKKSKRHFRRIVIPFMERDRIPEQALPARDEGNEEQPEDDEEDRVIGYLGCIDDHMDAGAPVDQNNGDSHFLINMSYPESPDVRDNNDELDMVIHQEEVPIGEGSSGHKSGRRRTLTANGDSGIDNISDDSFPEECPSDSEKTDEPGSLFLSAAPGTSKETSSDPPNNSNECSGSVEQKGQGPTDEPVRPQVRSYPHCRGSTVIFKRVAFSDPDSDELEEIESDSEGEEMLPRYDEKRYLSRYTYLIKQKINVLPIPHTLKDFLNLSRPV